MLDQNPDGFSFDDLRSQARDMVQALRCGGSDDLDRAKELVEGLRNARAYEDMGQLAEAVSRRDPQDARNRRLYAQYLIETGKATAAIDLLTPLTRRLPPGDPEAAEAAGLLGRSYKQVFVETDGADHAALSQAIAAYRAPFDHDPAGHTWHGVNLMALLTRARQLGLPDAPDLSPRLLAQQLDQLLSAVPKSKRDGWYFATAAETALGLGDWDAAERSIGAYAAAPDGKAFLVASTLRQLTEVWDIEAAGSRGRGLAAALRARLMSLPGGTLQLAPDDVKRLGSQPLPSEGQLEAVLGKDGPQTYVWWRTGLSRALAVGAVRQRLGGRIGTGFLLRARDLGLLPDDGLLVLTNFHVVNEAGSNQALRPGDAEVVFEAADASRAYGVASIAWSSPIDRHDATLLRLDADVAGIEPLPLAAALPLLDPPARVYIIGHPGGRDLAFSFQDNELLDHEGPDAGRPGIAGVVRVHYRAPTEGGSSGSPVFNSRLWEVTALHHKGGKVGMPRLNGQAGTYAANEGVSIQSIRAAIQDGAEAQA